MATAMRINFNGVRCDRFSLQKRVRRMPELNECNVTLCNSFHFNIVRRDWGRIHLRISVNWILFHICNLESWTDKADDRRWTATHLGGHNSETELNCELKWSTQPGGCHNWLRIGEHGSLLLLWELLMAASHHLHTRFWYPQMSLCWLNFS